MEDLGYVVGDEADVRREVAGLHLRQLPTGQVRVPSVVEGHVVADGVGKRQEKMRRAGDRFDVPVEVAVKYESCRSPWIVPFALPRENDPSSM